MSKDTGNNGQTTGAKKRSDDAVSTLMNLAGPRERISADIENRVHDNVRRRWQQATKQKTGMRWAVPVSLAAMLLVVFAFNIRTPEVAPQTIGIVAHVVGDQGPAGSKFAVGNPVLAGDKIDTGSGAGVSITLRDDVSLRIASNSSVRLDHADEIMLLRGQIYADSGDRIYRDRHLTVNTPYGTATDIGTQFSVAYEDSRMSVAVREGRVDVAHEQSVIMADAGDRVVLQSGRDVIVDQVAPYDPSWNWASSLAPDFRYQKPFTSRLPEMGRTRDRQVLLFFSSDEVRMAAMGTQVRGFNQGFHIPTRRWRPFLPRHSSTTK